MSDPQGLPKRPHTGPFQCLHALCSRSFLVYTVFVFNALRSTCGKRPEVLPSLHSSLLQVSTGPEINWERPPRARLVLIADHETCPKSRLCVLLPGCYLAFSSWLWGWLGGQRPGFSPVKVDVQRALCWFHEIPSESSGLWFTVKSELYQDSYISCLPTPRSSIIFLRIQELEKEERVLIHKEGVSWDGGDVTRFPSFFF